MYEMVLKMQAVQRRLIKKTESLVAKDVELRELERLNGELKKQLVRRPGPDVGERLNQFRHAVTARSRQIKARCVSASSNSDRPTSQHTTVQPFIVPHRIIQSWYTGR